LGDRTRKKKGKENSCSPENLPERKRKKLAQSTVDQSGKIYRGNPPQSWGKRNYPKQEGKADVQE